MESQDTTTFSGGVTTYEIEYNFEIMCHTLGELNNSIAYNPDIINDTQRNWFVIVIFVCLCGAICLIGIVSNTINLIVFFKQGFSNTVNISFFGLAISDFCCVATLLWLTICFNPLVINAGVVWVPVDFVYLTAAWPHNISSRITSYITIYVTLERYMCLTIPLKVKNIFSAPRTTVAVCLIFILNIATLLPEYSTSYLAWTFFKDTNKTLLAIAYKSGRENVAGLVYIINSTTGITSFVGIIFITVLLVLKLNKVAQWRKGATSGSHHQEAVSSRDKKMVKMVVAISTVLISCYTPGIIVSLVSFIEPEFDRDKRYVNSFISMWTISGVFQALNSSTNIILYYKMSSRYRKTFQKIFVVCPRGKTVG